MRSTKTTIRFKLSRAEDARALEYLRDRKAAGNVASFQPVHEIPQPSQENAEQTLAFLDAFDGME